MNSSEAIQKLRVKVAYLWGLGLGIVVTALQLMPKDSKAGSETHLATIIFGGLVSLAALVMTFYVRRREAAEIEKVAGK